MGTATACCLTAMVLTGSLLSQTDQAEPFAFKNTKLGMSVQDFAEQHRLPGHWQIDGVPGKSSTAVGSNDSSWKPPTGRNWVWKPDTECKEIYKGVTTCGGHHGSHWGYTDTIAELPARVNVFFADSKLAAIHLDVETTSYIANGQSVNTGDSIWQGLTAKFGNPQANNVHRLVAAPNCTPFFREARTALAKLSKNGKLWCTGNLPHTCVTIDQLCQMPTVSKQTCPPKHDGEPVLSCEPGQEYGSPVRTLRWDNGVSVINFNNNGCIADSFPYGDITTILEGSYCESTNTTTSDISIWYVDKELSKILLVHRNEAGDSAKTKAASDF